MKNTYVSWCTGFSCVGKQKVLFHWLAARIDSSAMRPVCHSREQICRGYVLFDRQPLVPAVLPWPLDTNARLSLDDRCYRVCILMERQGMNSVNERETLASVGKNKWGRNGRRWSIGDIQRSPITKKQREGTFSVRQVASSKVPRLALKRTSAITFSAIILWRGIDFLNLPAT